MVRDMTTARPRNEWPDDEFAEEDEPEVRATPSEWEQFYPRGKEWEPPEEISSTVPGRYGVPTIDDDLDSDPHAAPISYPSWTSDNSFVVSGTVGFVGARWLTRREARKWAKEKYGFIFEEYVISGKIAMRVPKPQAKPEVEK